MNIKEDVAYAEYDGLVGWRKNDKDAGVTYYETLP